MEKGMLPTKNNKGKQNKPSRKDKSQRIHSDNSSSTESLFDKNGRNRIKTDPTPKVNSYRTISFEGNNYFTNENISKRSKSFSDGFESAIGKRSPTFLLSSKFEYQDVRTESEPQYLQGATSRQTTPPFKQINQRDGITGLSQLHAAVIAKDTNRIKHFIELGGNIDLLDNQGNTALHQAFSDGDHKLAELLFTLGANPKITNNTKKNIAHLAASGNHRNLIGLIIERNLADKLFFEPDLEGYLPIKYLNPQMDSYKHLRTVMLCYHKFNFQESEEVADKPTSGKGTIFSRISSGSLLSSSIRSHKYSSRSHSTAAKGLDSFEQLTLASNVNIRKQYLAAIETMSSEIDRELFFIGIKSVPQKQNYYKGEENYKRLIQKYVFAKKVGKENYHGHLKSSYTTSLADIKYLAYSLHRLYYQIGSDEILTYINKYFSSRDYVIQLHSIYFVKELVLSLSLSNLDDKKFGLALEVFLSNINNNILAKAKITRNLQMLYFSYIQPLYNSIQQELSMQNGLSNSPRRYSSPAITNNQFIMHYENMLNEIAEGKLKPGESKYQSVLQSTSQDLVLIMSKLFVQVNPTNLLNYSAGKAPIVDPGYNPKTGFQNLEPIKEIIQTSENISIMIAYDILSYDLPGRVRVWEFYTHLVEHLLDGKGSYHIELNCICALIFGMHQNSIARLSETKNKLSQVTNNSMQAFESLIAVNANFRNLRSYTFKKGSYPALFLFTKDLTSINEIANQEDRMLAIGKLAFNFHQKAGKSIVSDFLQTPTTDVGERLNNIRLNFLANYKRQNGLSSTDSVSTETLKTFIDKQLYNLSIKRESRSTSVFEDDMSPDCALAILDDWHTKSAEEKISTTFLVQMSNLIQWNKEKLQKLNNELTVLDKERQKKIDEQQKHQRIVTLVDSFQTDITRTSTLRKASYSENIPNSNEVLHNTRSTVGNLDFKNIDDTKTATSYATNRVERRTPRMFKLSLTSLHSTTSTSVSHSCLTPNNSNNGKMNAQNVSTKKSRP